MKLHPVIESDMHIFLKFMSFFLAKTKKNFYFCQLYNTVFTPLNNKKGINYVRIIKSQSGTKLVHRDDGALQRSIFINAPLYYNGGGLLISPKSHF